MTANLAAVAVLHVAGLWRYNTVVTSHALDYEQRDDDADDEHISSNRAHKRETAHNQNIPASTI